MEGITSLLAIAAPSIVALSSLLVQAASTRNQMRTERAKVFYQDRISALRGLIKVVSEIERNAQQAVRIRNMACGMMGKSYREVWENKEKLLPDGINQALQAAVYGATFIGRKSLEDEIGGNQVFYPQEISMIVDKLETKYFHSLPEPLHPESIDQILEENIPFLVLTRKQLIKESQVFMMLVS